MQFLSLFHNETEVTDFSQKMLMSAELKEFATRFIYIYIFWGSYLVKVSLCRISPLWDMCKRF